MKLQGENIGKKQRTLRRYLISLVCFAAALLTSLMFAQLLPTQILFLLFLLAVFVSAWFGGFGPGLLNIILGGLAFDYLFILPTKSLEIENEADIYRLINFLLIGLTISGFSQIKLSAEERAAESLKNLRDREEELQAVLNTTPDLISRYDQNLRYLYVNQAWIDAFRLPPEIVIGKTDAELNLSIEDRFKKLSYVQSIFKSGGQQEVECDLEIDQETRTFHTYLVPEFDEHKRIKSVLVTERDITSRKKSEIAVRESEQRYRSLIEASTQIVWNSDASGHYVVDNATWRELTGQERDDFTPDVWLEMVHPGDREFVLAAWEDARRRKSKVEVEFRVQQKDRSYRDFFSHGVPILDEQGNVREWVGTLTDITESNRAKATLQKANKELEHRVVQRTEQFHLVNKALQDEIDVRYHVEAELLESELFAESVAEHSTLLIYVFDLDKKTTIYSNHNVAKFFGYLHDQIKEIDEESLATIIHPDDWPGLQRQIEQFRTVRDGEVIEHEWRARNARGEWRWLWVQEVVFKRHKNGSPAQIIGTAQDITERKKAEDALQQEKIFISAILDTVEAVVVVLDRDGRVVRFNKACERVTGLSFAEVEGKYFYDLLLLPEEMASVRQCFFQLQTNGFPKTYENYWVTKSGQRCLISWTNTVMTNPDGSTQYVISTGIDITEQRQTENALKQIFEQNSLRLTNRAS